MRETGSTNSVAGQRYPDDAAQRHAVYRERGWWQGERLEKHYERLIGRRPDELALVDNRGRRFTHEELWRASGDLVDSLRKRGIGPGDLAIIYMPNWAEWQVVFLALLRVQAVPAPIPVTTDADGLAYAVELTGSRLLIAADIHGGHDLGGAGAAVVARAGGQLDLMVVSEGGEYRWEATANSDLTRQVSPGVDMVMFTSSTTGRPKAVMHTTDTLAALNQAFTERFSLGPDQPIFMASPLGHSVGAYHGARLALYTGASLILQDRWDPAAALQMIDEYQCAFTAAATPFLRDLLEFPVGRGQEPGLSSLRSFLCGGAPVPPVLLERAARQFPRTFVTNLWGMTEGGVVTCVPDSPVEKIFATAGIGLPGLELRVLDAQGAVLAAGEEGELVMRGPGVFVGYLGQEDLYRSLMTPDGFFRTEDLACIDEQGYLQVTGRLKDLIIRGGVNISPIPIEDVLARHPLVQSVAVIGLPDERLGERIGAVILPGQERPGLDDLLEFAQQQGLSKRLCPEIVHYVQEMPKTAGGKIRKADLKRMILNRGADNRPNPVSHALTRRRRIADIEVAYSENGQGEAVVLVHGLAEDRLSFSYVQQQLREFHTFAYDLRGHGQTSLGDAQGTLDQLSEDLVAFLETVAGASRCVGYSLGGTVVLGAALMRPDLVKHAVVVGTSTVVGRAAAEFFSERIELVQRDLDAFGDALYNDTRAQIVSADADVAAITRRRLAAVGDGQGYINAARAMIGVNRNPLTPRLAEMDCPVDVIGADSDVFCPRKAADIMLDSLGRASYREVENAGHLVSVDQPDRYVGTLREALVSREI
ncbi:MAG: alpha/beta fold hydrolase [Halioglobus sp.]|nr:alpha/beta fold hydrolase [Halioglobus sp.]